MKWLSVKDAEEKVVASVDFARLLDTGETLSAPVVSSSVLRGEDATPSAIISGAAQVLGTVVAQLVIAGIDGVDYRLRFRVDTSGGKRLVFAVAIPVRTA